MAIERAHDDYESNRRQRLLKQPSVEDQLSAIWELLLPLVDERKLKGAVRDRVHAVKKAAEEHPEEND